MSVAQFDKRRAVHCNGQRIARYVPYQIDNVNAEVYHRSAARQFFIRKPAARIAVAPQILRLCIVYIAQHAVFDQLSCEHSVLSEPPNKAQREFYVFLFRGGF